MGKRIPLEGQKFGKLYVKEYIGNSKYHCLCDCGKERDVFATNLVRNHTTSCGCKKISDLTGKTFGFLKVLERAEGKKRGDIKRVRWKCECTRCGKIVDVYADNLIYGEVASCGCLRKDRDLPDELRMEFVDGTQLSKIQLKKTKANKSGVVGVNWDKARNKWQASIRFKGHKYNLGRFSDFDMACKAREAAEKAIFRDFLEWHGDKNMNDKERG